MNRRMTRSKLFQETNRNVRYILIAGWVITIALLATACRASTSQVTAEPTSPPTATFELASTETSLSKYLRFTRLTAEDVLSGDHTRNVVQDQHGLLWIGTLSGLNRFDGTSVKLYRNDPEDPNSLSHNIARALAVDQGGVLWVGTWGGGLNQFDLETDTFIRYQHDPDDPHSLSHNIVRAVYEDHSGTIWVGTMAGLNKLDRASGQFTRYQHNKEKPNSLSDNVIWSIYEDSTGALWVGTENGLNRFDPDTETFVTYRRDPSAPISLSHNSVRSVFEDSSGNLWVGTGGGLDLLSPDRTRITSYQRNENEPQSLSHNVIHWVHEDRSGRLWVGTWGGGLNLFDRDTETFIHYRHNSADSYSLSSDSIWQIYEGQQDMLWIATEGGISYFDGKGKPFHHYRAISGAPHSLSDSHVNSLHAGQDGVVWAATNSGGLNKFDRKTEAFTQYLNSASDPIDLSNDTLTAVYEDQLGLIWIGTRGKGLIKYDPDTEQVTSFRHDDTNPHSLSYDSIVNINEDRSGMLWIGTYGGGLNAFDRDTERFTRYQHDPSDPHSLSANVVISVYEDRAGILWIGTISDGLNKLDRETGTFVNYRHDASDPHSLSADAIVSMYEQETGDFWIGTVKGLDKFDRQEDQVIRSYSMKNGLPDDTISAILEDEQSQLWLGTQNGLSRFDPQTESFKNYTISDGLQGKSFTLYTPPFKSPGDEMFFHGAGGFNAFYPNQIVDKLNPPPVLITSFQLANKPVPIGGDSVLQKSVLETDEMVLSYRDNVFSFEFVALDYRDSDKNRYKYKMEGFEEEWNEVDSTRRFATYTNLDPGDFVFRVIASNNDGIWNEEGVSINIIITPPWWETVWFRTAMSAALIMMVIGVFRWRVSSIEARRRELEIQVQTRTLELETANKTALEAKESAESANRAKSTFLANMSHELRTPLNAILGFSRILVRAQNATADQKEQLSIINRSGQHLLSMINDVLDLSKIEARRVKLREHPFDLVVLMEEISVMIQSQAGEKGLLFEVETTMAAIRYIEADEGKLRQILINLLANAKKFTDEGVIVLRCISEQIQQEPTRCRIVIEVEDTGPGIALDRQENIFEPFAQGIDIQARRGTGLGLSISKNFVELMNGSIEVESEVEKGSIFRVKLPAKIVVMADFETSGEGQKKLIGLAPGQPAQCVLIVEDNRENRLLLGNLLREAGFEIREARNGEEAVDLFQQYHPHFIWMDIQMPVMDGYQATAKIRSLPGGDRVKIVAITASVFYEQRHDILTSGCDDVVNKPFEDHEIFGTMARMLDLEYLYEKHGEEAVPMEKVSLTKELLADLPVELLDELRETILELNREAAFEVISRIAELAPEVATGLKERVDNFQMVELQELLE